MQDDQQNQEGQQADQQQTAPPQGGILNQTFGEVLQNKEAQEKIMKSMHIGPEQFQKLLKTTENNPLTNMTMGQLFKSGFVQKAVQAEGQAPSAQTTQALGEEQQPEQSPQQQSVWDIIKGLFR